MNALTENWIDVGALETVISLGLFCSALLYVRWKFQHDRKLAGE